MGTTRTARQKIQSKSYQNSTRRYRDCEAEAWTGLCVLVLSSVVLSPFMFGFISSSQWLG
jgi:hypothetical protein